MNRILNRLKLISLVIFFSALGSAPSQAQNPDCDRSCLEDIARQYMIEVYRDNPSIVAARQTANDVVIREFSRLPWAETVRFTENNVAMMIGEGFWGAARGDMRELLVLGDEISGNVLWFGIIEEHEQAAYHAMRLKVVDSKITEVETYFGREGTPDLFAATAGYALDDSFFASIAPGQRHSREQLISIANSYLDTKQENDGNLLTGFTENCRRVTNVSVI